MLLRPERGRIAVRKQPIVTCLETVKELVRAMLSVEPSSARYGAKPCDVFVGHTDEQRAYTHTTSSPRLSPSLSITVNQFIFAALAHVFPPQTENHLYEFSILQNAHSRKYAASCSMRN